MMGTQMKLSPANRSEIPQTASELGEKDGKSKSVGESTDWSSLVNQIRMGDDEGMERLYQLFGRGIRFYLCRQLGPQELDDKVHDAFLIVVNAIQRGDLREPDRLMGFVRTIARRQVAAYIENAVHTRREQADIESGSSIADYKHNPEQEAIIRQKADLMKSVLNSLSPRDRDILRRFYLEEQPQEQICREMQLTETQFRLLKSRAKARFGEIGKKKLTNNGIFSIFLRTKSG